MGIPEKPTLVERFVRLIPIRYPFAALAWAIILGSPVFHLVEYIDHGSTTFSLGPSNLYADLFYTLVPFYSFCAVRYLRVRIVKAEQQIVPIVSGGETVYHSAFGRISNTLPVVLLAIPFSAVASQAAIPFGYLSILGVWSAVSTFLNSFAIAAFVWSYAVSSWGLRMLGRSQLNLKSFLEDRMMGARPIGNVALSSTVAYLGGLLIVFLLFPSYFASNPAFQAIMTVLLVLGVVLFFLPLNSFHEKMQLEKTRHQREVSSKLMAMRNEAEVRQATVSGSLEKVEDAITQLVRLKDLEITERRLASTPTWPFDVQLIGKLITIILSVTAVLLSRIIVNFLHL